MKENSVLWYFSSAFFCLFCFCPSLQRFKKQSHTIGTPMMIDGLAMSPSIADQNRDKGFAAVSQTFYISKDQIISKNLLRECLC